MTKSIYSVKLKVVLQDGPSCGLKIAGLLKKTVSKQSLLNTLTLENILVEENSLTDK